jgi:hypothetical protein
VGPAIISPLPAPGVSINYVLLMRLFLFLIALVWLLGGSAMAPAYGQGPRPRPLAYSLAVDYDTDFGVTPTLAVSLPLDSVRQLTAYATYYTQAPSSGLETGLSLRLPLFRGKATVSPAIGLLSGRLFVAQSPWKVGEGFIGSVTAEKTGRRWALQGFMAYYGALRLLGPATYDFAFYQVAGGWKVTKGLTLGALHEQLRVLQLPRNQPGDQPYQLVRVGLFVQLPLPGKWQLQATGGWLADAFVRFSLNRSLTLGRKGGPVLTPK